ncbi:MAG: flagellar motor switch protein FliG [Deltaproteobacteria bacterium]|nr:MAG: flagellar motor switch protein FliG [Deltaproteobacteria bacterium]
MAEEGRRLQKLSGPQKAALLLLYLGEEVAGQVLKRLKEDEIQKIILEMTKVSGVPRHVMMEVLREFVSSYQEKEMVLADREYLEKVLAKALGMEKAKMILETVMGEEEERPFSYLQKIDTFSLANYLRTEHPQTIALILFYLDKAKAAQVLANFPEELQAEVIKRIATIDRISPDMLHEVEEALREGIKVKAVATVKGDQGFKVAAEILNQFGSQAAPILDKIRETDPDISEEVEKAMFVFEDLLYAEDRGLQKLLREVSKEDLALALKMCPEELQEKIFKNMSERAVEMLKEDMEALGPVRVKDVEEAQRRIAALARAMMEKGELILVGKGGEEVLV